MGLGDWFSVEPTARAVWEMEFGYRFHLRWSKKGVFSELLQIHVGRVGLDGRKVIDATHIKVH